MAANAVQTVKQVVQGLQAGPLEAVWESFAQLQREVHELWSGADEEHSKAAITSFLM